MTTMNGVIRFINNSPEGYRHTFKMNGRTIHATKDYSGVSFYRDSNDENIQLIQDYETGEWLIDNWFVYSDTMKAVLSGLFCKLRSSEDAYKED